MFFLEELVTTGTWKLPRVVPGARSALGDRAALGNSSKGALFSYEKAMGMKTSTELEVHTQTVILASYLSIKTLLSPGCTCFLRE